MSWFCAKRACKAQKGMCIHEKMMIALVVLFGIAAMAHLLFHLV